MRAWLDQHNVPTEERDFFQHPFSDAELRSLVASINPVRGERTSSPAHPELVEGNERDKQATQSSASILFSWKSPSFKPALSKVEGAMGLSPDSLTDDDLIRLMLSEPRLIRRPITRIGNRIIIGADFNALQEALG